MNNTDKLNIALGIIKYASPRWVKVLSAIPKEEDKISWLRSFIPKNVGIHSVNPVSAFDNPYSYRLLANDLSKALPWENSTNLLDKFKRLHRHVLNTKGLRESYPLKSYASAPIAGASWLREHNKYFPSRQLGPNDLVPFSHGGGLSHINTFLKGKGGYRTDSGAHGIMISPHRLMADRDIFYASRNTVDTFDTPASLSGYVPAKYLKNSRNNGYSRNTGYEASLPSKYFDKIVNKNVKPFDADSLRGPLKDHSYALGKSEASTRLAMDWEKFKERVSRASSLKSFDIISKL